MMKSMDVEAGYIAGKVGIEEQATDHDAPTLSIFEDQSRQNADLSWTNVNMTLKSKNGEGVQKQILKDVWGVAKSGQTTAIMGASGAGKTSLFSILSGRAKSRGRVEIQANIYLGGKRIDPSGDLRVRTMFAFVAQEESLHEASTPRESFRFSAKLRLPKTTTDKEINDLVDAYVQQLGLTSCADSIIGGGLTKGISGGEKRRTSIGVELISKPTFIFLDEPTSGLDSFAAKQVMQLLKRVALAGNTVLFTVHQPSSSVFSSFDQVILLNKGRMMYHGSTSTTTDDFAAMGYPEPGRYNPADWIVEVAQSTTVEALKEAGFFPRDTRKLTVEKEDLHIPDRGQHASLWTELVELMTREKTSVIKKPAPLIINISITAFLAIVFGVIFFGVGGGDRTNLVVVQGQLGAIVNILISTMMGQSQTALAIFASERPLFLREYSTNHYSIVTYFLSNLVAEAFQSFCATFVQAVIVYWMIDLQMHFLLFLVITYSLAMTSTAVSVLLGAMVSDTKSAAALFTLVVVPQFYFSGVFLATNLIPVWVRWAQYLCSLKYAAGLSFIYEFGSCPAGEAQENCMAILEQNSVKTSYEWWYWLAMVSLFFLFRLLALMVLQRKGKEFL